jgi:DivIVA domain-containing protein
MERMDLSPQSITSTEFTLVRKGYDPEEVRTFLSRVGTGLEEMRSQFVAADARARAAMARLQELSSREPTDDADTISKTLLVAQRTADAVTSDAQRSADSMMSTAEMRAKTLVADAESKSTEMLRQAELQAKTHVEASLRELTQRRSALQSEVSLLNERILAERERVASVIESLQQLLRSPQGLGALSYRTNPNDRTAQIDAVEQRPAESEVSSSGEIPVTDPWSDDETSS